MLCGAAMWLQGPPTTCGAGELASLLPQRPSDGTSAYETSGYLSAAALWRVTRPAVSCAGGRRRVERRGRRLRQKPGTVDDRRDVVAKHERADVEEEEQPAEREEDRHQQHRHDADEDVGEDQLSPDAPQQAMTCEHVDSIPDRHRADENRKAAQRVDRAEQSRLQLRETTEPCDELQRHACDEQTAGKRLRQPGAHGVEACSGHGVWCEGWQLAVSLEYPSNHREAARQRSIQHGVHPRGPGTRSVDWRDHHAHLSDLDLRAGGARQAQGLRVRAHAEPDAQRARGQPCGDRERSSRVRVCLWHGRDRCRDDAPQGGRSRRRHRQYLRRHVSIVRARAAEVSARFHLRRYL